MTILRRAVVGITAYYVRMFRKLRPASLTEILVIPAASRGSLGDQALLQGIQNHFSTMPSASVRQVLSLGVEEIDLLNPCLEPLRVAAQSLSSDVRLLLSLRKAQLFCVTGADVTDGRYSVKQSLFNLHCLEIAAKCGAPARLLGFSFSESPAPNIVDRFRSLRGQVELFGRDPVSRLRFEKATNRKITQSADLAFLMRPIAKDASAVNAISWLSKRRADGSKFSTAINANALTWKNSDEIVLRYTNLIEHLVEAYSNPSILLVPHDSRGELSDYVLNRRILDALSPNVRENVHCVTGELSAWSAKAITEECDLIVTGRMHFAIAALDTIKPVVCIGYMGKFEGLLGFFGLEDALMTPEEAYSEGKLIEKVELIAADLEQSTTRIAQNIDRVRELAKVNFGASKPD